MERRTCPSATRRFDLHTLTCQPRATCGSAATRRDSKAQGTSPGNASSHKQKGPRGRDSLLIPHITFIPYQIGSRPVGPCQFRRFPIPRASALGFRVTLRWSQKRVHERHGVLTCHTLTCQPRATCGSAATRRDSKAQGASPGKASSHKQKGPRGRDSLLIPRITFIPDQIGSRPVGPCRFRSFPIPRASALGFRVKLRWSQKRVHEQHGVLTCHTLPCQPRATCGSAATRRDSKAQGASPGIASSHKQKGPRGRDSFFFPHITFIPDQIGHGPLGLVDFIVSDSQG